MTITIRESGNGIQVGDRIGKLTVLGWQFHLRNDKGECSWHCVVKCSCGNTKTVLVKHLSRRKTQSCGCHKRESARNRRLKHGESKTPLYLCWRNIIMRCTDPTRKDYQHYCERGVTICNDWRNSYEEFRDYCLYNTDGNQSLKSTASTTTRVTNPETFVLSPAR